MIEDTNENEDALWDFKLPSFLRAWLLTKMLPASDMHTLENYHGEINITAKYKDMTVKLTHTSRFGDLAIELPDKKQVRVMLNELSDFKEIL